MTIALADLQARRDALVMALGSGVLAVTDQNGERVEYRNTAAMLAAINWLDRRIAEATTGINSPTTIRIRTSQGT